jgi:uncharacterized membrane protein
VSLKKLGIPKDLAAILLMTVIFDVAVVTPQLSGTFVRGILGILLVCFLPGYAISNQVLGKSYRLLEKVAIGFGFSITITCITVMVLNFTWGITEQSLVVVLSFLTYLAAFFCLFNVVDRIKTTFHYRNKFQKKANTDGPANL